jgi:hypothetical protein
MCDCETFVAPGRDEITAVWSVGALVNGAPVVDWTVSERELAMGGHGRSRGGGLALGCGIALAALLVLAAAGVFVMFFLVGSVDQGMIEPAEYEAVEVGADEDEVRDRLPSGETIATTG